MRDLASTFRAVECIEAHLQAEVTVAEMAEAAGYSLYHFIRAFNEDTHYTPYDYLIRRRLSQAALDLLASDARVLDISLAYRFNNHETFSRAFKRLLGVQPVQWRERGLIPHRALTPPLTLPYLEHIHRPDFEYPRRVHMPPRILAGLMAPDDGTLAALPNLWRSLDQVVSYQPAERIVVITHLDHRTTFCLAALEFPSFTAIPPLLVNQTLPAGGFLCITHTGQVNSLTLTLDYLHHTWLRKTGAKPANNSELVAWSATGQPVQVSILLR